MAGEGLEEQCPSTKDIEASSRPRRDLVYVICWFLQWPAWICFLIAFTNESWVQTSWGDIGLWTFCNYSNPHVSPTDGTVYFCMDTERAEGPGWLDYTRTALCVTFVTSVAGLWFCTPVSHLKDRVTNTRKWRIKRFIYFRWQEIMHACTSILIGSSLPLYHINYSLFYTEMGHEDMHLEWAFYMMSTVGGIFFCITLGFWTCKDKKHVRGMKETDDAPEANLTSNDRARVTNNVEVKSSSTLRNIASPNMVILAINRLRSAKPRRDNNNNNNNNSKTKDRVDSYKQSSGHVGLTNSRRNSVTSATSDVSDVSLTDYLKDIQQNGGVTTAERKALSPFTPGEAFVLESTQSTLAEAPTTAEQARRQSVVIVSSGPDFTTDFPSEGGVLSPSRGGALSPSRGGASSVDIYDIPEEPCLPACLPPAYDDVMDGDNKPPPHVVLPPA